MSATRDINAAWNEAKRKAAKEYPEEFILAGLNSTIKKKTSEFFNNAHDQENYVHHKP